MLYQEGTSSFIVPILYWPIPTKGAPHKHKFIILKIQCQEKNTSP